MNFFLTITPGFERLALQELESWLPDLKPEHVRLEHGGINLKAELNVGLELNRCLRLPTRILLRVADFGCRDFPKLFKKLSTLAWGDWIPDLKQVDFQVSTHGSRVKMKKRIEETCLSARIQYLKKKGLPHSKVFMGPEADFTFYIRFDNDVCFVSLDTSGERLHKRGVRTQSSEAPLRETFAAGLLSLMEDVDGADSNEVAVASENDRAIELVDPMMGGATFLLEAAGRRAKIESREFSYLQNPVLLARARDDGSVPVRGDGGSSRYRRLIGYERSAKTAQAATDNLGSHLHDCGRDAAVIEIQTRTEDFFEAKALPTSTLARRWVVCNPPYGERLQVEGPLAAYYEKLMAQVELVTQPDLICLLLPQKVQTQKLKIPVTWRFRKVLKFSNGGLPVEAVVYGRRRAQ